MGTKKQVSTLKLCESNFMLDISASDSHSKSLKIVPKMGPEYLVSRVLGLLSCLMQRCGFDPPPGRIFPVEGFFPFELTWVPHKLFQMRV